MLKALTLSIACLLFSSPLLADTIWLDVRSHGEFAGESLPGSINIPHTQVATDISATIKDKEAKINVYCRSGGRSGMALGVLQKMGYSNVTNVGGISDARKLQAQ
ncbi:MAG: rhodanese-like domain-containing protein [Bermanella sp.]